MIKNKFYYVTLHASCLRIVKNVMLVRHSWTIRIHSLEIKVNSSRMKVDHLRMH